MGWANDEYYHFDPTQPRKSQTEKRILLLGDSFLAGSGVSAPSKRLGNVLSNKYKENIVVKQLAVGDWGTDQQYLSYLSKGKLWKLDIVILAFCATNDITNIFSYWHPGNWLKPYFVLTDNNSLELKDAYGDPKSYKQLKK